jgi:alpha-beta hydrolase superfamily lysophospholipase
MTAARDDARTPGPAAAEEDWAPDLLGPGFEARPLALPGGAEAVLVRHTPSLAPAGEPARVAVLAVHGFADYFFHPHVARAVADAGHAFYAVDLRGHGRAWDAHVAAGGDPNLVPDVAVYAQDLDAAAAVVRQAGHERLVVLGHSTGGLIAPLWASAREGRADALVLNSPWFEHHAPRPLRWAGVALAETVAPLAPRAVLTRLGDDYARALHVDHGGAWEFDPAWKPHTRLPVRAAWARSVRRSQRRLTRGLDLQVPVLVLASDRTTRTEHLTSDTVLDVEDMRRIAPRLGTDISFMTIQGGAHDLSLSAGAASEEFLRCVTDWIAVAV